MYSVMKISAIQNYQNVKYNPRNNNNKAAKNNAQSSEFKSYPSNYYVSFTAAKPLRFDKAKSYPEARDFGRRILGVAQYEGFENSLDVMNYINEGLVSARNNSRQKPKLPRYINFKPLDKIQMSTRYFGGGELDVNSSIYEPKELVKEIRRIFYELAKDGVITRNIDGVGINKTITTPEIDELFKNINTKYRNMEQLSYDEKMELYDQIRTIYEKTSQLNRFPKDLIVKMLEAGCWGKFDEVDTGLFAQELAERPDNENFIVLYEFLKEYDCIDFKLKNDSFKHKTLFHEIGHLQDWGIFLLPSVGEFQGYKRYSKEMKEWVNDKEAMRAAFQVSPYACFGAPEFVAEAYALQLAGKKLPPDAEKLYKKLGAPEVVLR